MTRIATLLLTAILVQAAAAVYGAPTASLHWVQIGPGGAAELRAITAGADCPSATIDGVSYRLVQRAAPNANFQRNTKRFSQNFGGYVWHCLA